MSLLRFLLDSNLLVLLIAGTTDSRLIGRHKRLKEFAPSDFELLIAFLAGAELSSTAHAFAEVSNLLGQSSDYRSRLTERLQEFLVDPATVEVPVDSRVAAGDDVFKSLRLTDCGLLEACRRERLTLFTVDLDLYLHAKSRGLDAINFNEVISAADGL